MAEGRQRDEWSRTSLLAALIVNGYLGGQARPLQPRDFDPYAADDEERAPDAGWPITILKDVFIDSAYAKSQMRKKEGAI